MGPSSTLSDAPNPLCPQCAGGDSYDGPTKCCLESHPCEMIEDDSEIGFCPTKPRPTCAMRNMQCGGGVGFDGPTTCCSINQYCAPVSEIQRLIDASDSTADILDAVNISICVHNDSMPFQIQDLKSCDTVPDKEYNFQRRDCEHHRT